MNLLRSFFRVDLPPAARRTYHFHLAYALFDAAAGGILLNAPNVALKLMAAGNWQLFLRETYSGIGTLLAVYLGGWMAERRKLPFVIVPGMACGLLTLAMVGAVSHSFLFLTLLGVGAMCELATRPATASILRLNYPVSDRGRATGEVRKWSSLMFMASSLSSAALLQTASGETVVPSVQALLVLASVLSLAGFLCFARIRVNEDVAQCRSDFRPEVFAQFRAAWQIVAGNARYRRYLTACFFDGFCGALYLPAIWALLKALQYDYVGSAALMHVVPALTAFLATGWLGRWFDHANPWWAWAWIRFAWGLDALLLALTPFAAPYVPPAVLVLPLLGRILRGSVQGGQWVMWWQIGVTHFAPPGTDTSRYLGIMALLNGTVRLIASAAGMALMWWHVAPTTLLAVGGLGIIAVGLYSLVESRAERHQANLATIAAFEAQFTTPTPPAPARVPAATDAGPSPSGQ